MKQIKLPLAKIPLNSDQLLYLVKKFKIKHFRGVFSRNKLPRKSKMIECGIVNLDDYKNTGSHWTAWYRNKNCVLYHDPIGNVSPPSEIIKYFKSVPIFYNHESTQKPNSVNCGHMCIKFLIKYNKNFPSLI